MGSRDNGLIAVFAISMRISPKGITGMVCGEGTVMDGCIAAAVCMPLSLNNIKVIWLTISPY